MSENNIININNDDDILLSVRDLHTYFYTEEGVVKAVDGVSFDIPRNKIVGLVGETGCGKSVTALSILKLIRSPGKIVNGKIIFDGEDLVKKTNEEIRKYRGNKITMIFQDPLNSLNPVLKVGEQISEVFLLHQMDDLKEKLAEIKTKNNEIKAEIEILKENIKTENDESIKKTIKQRIKTLKSQIKKVKIEDIALEESAKILDTVGIPDSTSLLDRYPHELSGGMRQRVMISMGLACRPKLLICDEPTTALDVTIQAQILELIRELQEKIKNSVLFITHDLGVIYELCDIVVIMYSGNIVEYGTVGNVMENPLHPYAHGLLNAIPRINPELRKQKLEIIKGMVPNLIYPPTGCRFHPRCEHAMRICKDVDPKLEMVENRLVACHLYYKEEPNKPELYEKLPEEEKEQIL